MDKTKTWIYLLVTLLTILNTDSVFAANLGSLKRLQQAYPDHIASISNSYIGLKDGTHIPIEGQFSWLDRAVTWFYHLNLTNEKITQKDAEHERYEPLLKKMYGHTPTAVKKNLVTIYWMPNVFGKRYPLRVTTVNGVDKKLKRISAELEKLPKSYHKYVANPAGSFYWRNVAGESYLSSHSFGIAIDINPHYCSYWMWDFERLKKPIWELSPRTQPPLRIVQIFEKEGFLWGGRWYFYDTMHFEYRPDLLL